MHTDSLKNKLTEHLDIHYCFSGPYCCYSSLVSWGSTYTVFRNFLKEYENLSKPHSENRWPRDSLVATPEIITSVMRWWLKRHSINYQLVGKWIVCSFEWLAITAPRAAAKEHLIQAILTKRSWWNRTVSQSRILRWSSLQLVETVPKILGWPAQQLAVESHIQIFISPKTPSRRNGKDPPPRFPCPLERILCKE